MVDTHLRRSSSQRTGPAALLVLPAAATRAGAVVAACLVLFSFDIVGFIGFCFVVPVLFVVP